MICEKCGNNIPDAAVFCGYCGTPQKKSSDTGTAKKDIPDDPQGDYNAGRGAPEPGNYYSAGQGAPEPGNYYNTGRGAPEPGNYYSAGQGGRPVSAARARLMNRQAQEAQYANHGRNRSSAGYQGDGIPVRPGYPEYRDGGGNTYARRQYPDMRTSYHNPGNARQAASTNKWPFILIGETVLLLILVVSAVTIYSNSQSCQKRAEKYFVSLVNGDYEEAYSYLNIEEDTFINPDTMAHAFSKYDFSEVDNYYVQEDRIYGNMQTNNNGLGSEIIIVYRNKGAQEDSYFYTSMVKSGKSGKWYVSSSNLISSNIKIRVPFESGVSVDGIELAEEYVSEETDEYSGELYSIYTIPRLFNGEHYLRVSAEGRQDLKGRWETYGDEETITMKDLLYSEETIETIQEKASSNMRRIYAAVLKEEDFDSIADLFTSDDQKRQNIRENYEQLVRDMRGDYFRMKKMAFREIEGSSWTNSTDVELTFTCSAEYSTTNSWSGEVEEGSGEKDCRMSFNFVQENGNWVQENLGCSRITF